MLVRVPQAGAKREIWRDLGGSMAEDLDEA
jgi:hypothetical protein